MYRARGKCPLSKQRLSGSCEVMRFMIQYVEFAFSSNTALGFQYMASNTKCSLYYTSGAMDVRFVHQLCRIVCHQLSVPSHLVYFA
jgi:hypothetical protein